MDKDKMSLKGQIFNIRLLQTCYTSLDAPWRTDFKYEP